MNQSIPRKLILETGETYIGRGFGSCKDRVLEIVFNTSMTGYQEILSDPSYTDQAVVMTYPIIGSYGIAEDDFETGTPSIGAMIVHEYNDEPSGSRSVDTLGNVLERFDIVGVSGIDTRKLNRSIRDRGSRRVLITSAQTSLEEGLEVLQNHPLPSDAVSRVSCRKIRSFPADHPRYHVAAIDCGIKQGIIRSLNSRHCSVTLVPWDTPAEVIKSLNPDGIFVSNGPGDPTHIPQTSETLRLLRGFCPIFGICLGHQLIALSYGAKTYKLKFGHRGGNHPVRNLETGRIEMTSQNHSYAVDEASLAGTPLRISHVNLLDGTVEGLRCDRDSIFTVQYHPEGAPGPEDSSYLFDQFIQLMEAQHSHVEKK